ncbi:O-glucosyltransferase rumi homolog [Camellia sinensis]|uniref:O-glucosyltransferase rumi homolog n=1 Tax=Camellia sinensis TaxID=4442 RepID=UPI001035CC2E|nr:O-glucosyltransferase rumi homolog [Camellia sinensis]
MGDRICSLFLRKLIEQPMKTGAPVRVSLIFFLVLLIGAFVCLHWIDVVPSPNTGISLQKMFLPSITSITSPIGINCSITCPENSPVTVKDDESLSSKACPEYFQWIQQDLNPWKEKGITKQMVESVESKAHMRIVVVNGRVYVKKLRWVYQTRDVYTVWGILQLLRLYPGKLPDLDFMFECGDKPVILKSDYGGSKAKKVPPMLHYCGSNSTLDIVFPDWSFWGWPELKIKPWKTFKKDLEEGNQRVKWIDRIPYAYWKGNSRVSSVRKGLHKCNVTHKQDWGALIYELDWKFTREEKFKNTDLANQCTHRYKIYVEGAAWSVSEKYILACDSMSLLVTPHYYDFFTRSLLPSIHYWPINENDMCKSIKFAVDWGNKHPQKAQEIGKAGSKFVQEELNMKNVYDYMFHLLYEYGKLLKYKPTVPDGSIEVCSETMACSGKGLRKKFKINSMVKGPADTSPCTMPPPYDPTTLQSFLQRKENLTKQVERWRKSEKM